MYSLLFECCYLIFYLTFLHFPLAPNVIDTCKVLYIGLLNFISIINYWHTNPILSDTD